MKLQQLETAAAAGLMTLMLTPGANAQSTDKVSPPPGDQPKVTDTVSTENRNVAPKPRSKIGTVLSYAAMPFDVIMLGWGTIERGTHLQLPVKHYVLRFGDNAFRSSRLTSLTEAEMKTLLDNGLGSKGGYVVNLQAERPNGDRKLAAQYGFTSVSIPVTDNWHPSEDQMLTVLNLFEQARKRGQPVDIHCSAGVGRTGEFVAVVSDLIYGMDPDEALREAHRLGMVMPNQDRFVRNFLKKVAEGKIARATYTGDAPLLIRNQLLMPGDHLWVRVDKLSPELRGALELQPR